MAAAIPEHYHSVTPMVVFKDARKAIEVYKRAFGARERLVMPGRDGTPVMHAELMIGDSILMMGEEHAGNPCKSAETMGGSPVSFYLYHQNVDEAFGVAGAAAAEIRMAAADMFWGDRMGTVQEPFGHTWSLASHGMDLTPDEISRGAKAGFSRMTQE